MSVELYCFYSKYVNKFCFTSLRNLCNYHKDWKEYIFIHNANRSGYGLRYSVPSLLYSHKSGFLDCIQTRVLLPSMTHRNSKVHHIKQKHTMLCPHKLPWNSCHSRFAISVICMAKKCIFLEETSRGEIIHRSFMVDFKGWKSCQPYVKLWSCMYM